MLDHRSRFIPTSLALPPTMIIFIWAPELISSEAFFSIAFFLLAILECLYFGLAYCRFHFNSLIHEDKTIYFLQFGFHKVEISCRTGSHQFTSEIVVRISRNNLYITVTG